MREDDYERKYMTEGDVLYRHRAMPSRTFHLLLLLVALTPFIILVPLSLNPAIGATILWAALPLLLVMLPVWLLFSVLRVAVTQEHVHIQYGLFGPKVPMRSVESCEAVTYDWKAYGGFGIRRGADGSTAYNLMGDEGKAVRIVWRDGSGKPQITLVSARDPEALVAAVTKARSSHRLSSSAATTKRLEQQPSPERAAELAEAEAELEAELAAEANANVKRAPGSRDPG